jgi:hypothetical protein
MRCGYPLVGPPVPRRCPECGFPVVHQSRWLEGELHRAGPIIVWPIARRFWVAAALLIAALVAEVVLYADALKMVGLAHGSTARWAFVPFFVVAPAASLIWRISINGPGADHWGLHRQAALRRWLPLCGLWFWIVGVCVVENNLEVPATADPSPWLIGAVVILVPALIGWAVVLFHLSRVSLYLRNDLPQRMSLMWSWALGLCAVAAAIGCALNGELLLLEKFLWFFAWFAVPWSAAMAAVVAWDLANCLTHSYETVAREERLAKKNAERFSTPK